MNVLDVNRADVLSRVLALRRIRISGGKEHGAGAGADAR